MYKHLILAIVFYGFIYQNLHAQNQRAVSSSSLFYVKASAGYGIGINGEYFESSVNGNVTNATSKLGNGLYYTASGGYQCNNNIAAELGISYAYGFKNNEYPSFNGNSATLSGNMWQITPSVVFSTRTGKFIPYIRTGLIIASPEVFINEVSNLISGTGAPNIQVEKVKIYGGLSTGIQAAIGCSLPLKNQNWTVFAEASFNNIGFLPEKAVVYSATTNGVDQLSTLSVSGKEAVFQKNYSGNPFTNNPSKPQPVPEAKYPFGSLAFSFGIKMSIGNIQVPGPDDKYVQHYFVRIGVGYGFSTNGDVNYQASNSIFKAINVSYGNGINTGLGVAYMIKESLGFDLGLNYNASATIKAEGSGTLAQNIYQFGTQTSEYGDMIQLNPSLVLATHIKKFLPYARLGFLIGSGNVYYTYEDKHAFLNGGYYDRRTTLKYYGGASLGYSAVLGTAYWMSYKYDLFGEACFNNIYEIPEKAQVTQDNYNGTSNLANESNSQKNIVFKSSYNDNANSDPNSATISSPVKFSFNAVAFRVGMRIWLSRKKQS